MSERGPLIWQSWLPSKGYWNVPSTYLYQDKQEPMFLLEVITCPARRNQTVNMSAMQLCLLLFHLQWPSSVDSQASPSKAWSPSAEQLSNRDVKRPPSSCLNRIIPVFCCFCLLVVMSLHQSDVSHSIPSSDRLQMLYCTTAWFPKRWGLEQSWVWKGVAFGHASFFWA